MSHEVETMFADRFTPWHIDETRDRVRILEGPATKQNVLVEAGLDWTVSARPIYMEDNEGAEIQVPGYTAIVRDKDQKVYQVSSDKYSIIENGQSVDFVEALLDTGEVYYKSGGSLREGAITWLLVELAKEVRFGDDATFYPFLAIGNSHNGSMPFGGFATPVCIQCMNTFRLARGQAKHEFRIRHTLNAQSRIDEARRALGLAFNYFDKFEVEVEKLMSQVVTDAQFYSIVKGLFPEDDTESERVQATQERRRNTVEAIYFEGSATRPFVGTGYGTLASVNEWEQWSTRAINPSRKSINAFSERHVRRALDDQFPYTQKTEKILSLMRKPLGA